ncbi:hypothetical protein MCHI_003320 [Candidatus Magnetoovum chiemensis]|nr:hypothetical protein MCHI_003320 [Candidatus Magnetoovum chiemensis]
MKDVKQRIEIYRSETWLERSGFLDFLTLVPYEVEKFNKTFGFDINYISASPKDIDGDKDKIANVGFVLTRNNILTSGRVYCFYSLLNERTLEGYIGLYNEGHIKTLRKLSPIKDYKNITFQLYDWLSDTVKASCDKL